MRYFYFWLNMLLVPIYFILALIINMFEAFYRAYWETREGIIETKRIYGIK